MGSGRLVFELTPHGWVELVDPEVNGSEEAITVIVLVLAGVLKATPLLHAINPLAEIARRAAPISIVIVPHAPRTNLRRVQKRSNPVKPPSHQIIEPCAGEFGGLFTTTVNVVVGGGYVVLEVLAITLICPGEKTQMELTGSEEAKH